MNRNKQGTPERQSLSEVKMGEGSSPCGRLAEGIVKQFQNYFSECPPKYKKVLHYKALFIHLERNTKSFTCLKATHTNTHTRDPQALRWYSIKNKHDSVEITA